MTWLILWFPLLIVALPGDIYIYFHCYFVVVVHPPSPPPPPPVVYWNIDISELYVRRMIIYTHFRWKNGAQTKVGEFFFCILSNLNSTCCHSKWNMEPPHDKINNVVVRPAKTQISLGIRPVWSESSLSAWRKFGSLATHWAHSEDSDQTGRMPRLIWVFAGRTLTLLVLSWGGSYSYMFLPICTGSTEKPQSWKSYSTLLWNGTKPFFLTSFWAPMFEGLWIFNLRSRFLL